MSSSKEASAKYRRDYYRCQPGRKAVVAGGVFVPVKQEVPRHRIPPEPCAHCPKATFNPLNGDGIRLCDNCQRKVDNALKPKRRKPVVPREWECDARKLQKGMAWVRCCRCGGKLQRRPEVVGPYLGPKCFRIVEYQGALNHQGIKNARPHSPDLLAPDRKRRGDALRAMYEAVEAAGGETAALNLKLPTSASDLQLDTHRDPPPEDPADDLEAEEADAE